jgi:flagellar motility protein MotE (MotC chaperone)
MDGIRQTGLSIRDCVLVLYLLIAALAAASLLLFVWLRERRWRQRQAGIRDLLDGADALEAQLQECRLRMQRVRGMLSVLPEEMSADANSALSADNKVQAALKDLLAHRLWIKQHALDASLQQLTAARSALAQSGATLGAQLDRLTATATDLERAQTDAQTLGRSRPS